MLYYQEWCTFPLLQAMGGTGSQTFGSVQQVFMMPETMVTDKGNKVWAMDACCAATQHYSASLVHLLKVFKALTKKGRSTGGIPSFGSNGLVGGRALRRICLAIEVLPRYAGPPKECWRADPKLDQTGADVPRAHSGGGDRASESRGLLKL